MASPQYSTPYSQLSYPSYTPLSVLPVKPDGSLAWSSSSSQHRPSNSSDANLRLLRAAVRSDVTLRNNTATTSLPAHAEATHGTAGTGWPAPNTGLAQRRTTGVCVVSTQSTRTNAPLYAPQPAMELPPASSQHHSLPASTVRYSDIDRVQSLPNAALLHRGSPLRGTTRTITPHVVAVDGTEVDAQSDVVCAGEAVPYLCAFQEECQSLLALLSASPAPVRPAVAAPPGALQPSPYQPVQSSHKEVQHPALLASTTNPTPFSNSLDAAPTLRPAPVPPELATLPTSLPTTASVAVPLSSVSPPPPPSSSSSLQPSLSPLASAPPESASTAANAAAASPPTSTTYAQLLQEMDELASLLQHDDSTDAPPEQHDRQGQQKQRRQLSSSPEGPHSSASALTSPPTFVDQDRGTPEKQRRLSRPSSGQINCRPEQHPSSTSRLAPSAAELIAPSPSSFWAAQLLKWVTFLIERKQGVLRSIQSFENTRAPHRRGATAANSATEEALSRESAAVKAAAGLLQLLRSLNPTASVVEGWTSQQQRQMCTRVANMLAELTSSEETVVADLLNDAAAGATMEREGVMKQNDARSGGHPSAVSVTPPAPAVSLPPEYRDDMLETLALLESLSKENEALKLQVMNTQGELRTLRDEVRSGRDARNAIVAHFERVSQQNTDLTSRLRDAEARLREAETQTRANPQEDVLRDQLDRQTSNLRAVRRELDDTKEECDALRRTVLQLRETVVRHRTAIDLLTRHRREREHSEPAARPSSSRQASLRQSSPPMQLIEDILSGACDALSSTLTSATNSEEEEEDYDVSNEASSDNDHA
ncbi:hypothetical protein ABL78_0262 [Leptomonas seymouri]|uniref:Uncharacterized protein n=1 Tax=Leptomonas seymouri TaxID=5684 RepID=A0A0N0P938_LEPSE|nr:hypothetical protein ABL78_0262 [Leptomonas seymouri]|eukprot:KPI90666.1 hypothetical protein ABL78_0262 [Leptomonas seymouri]